MKRRYFTRLFIIVAFVAIGPVVITGLLYYRSTSMLLRDQLEDSSVRYVEEVVFVTEMILEQVTRTAQIVLFTPEYADLVQLSGRKELLDLPTPYADDDMPSLYRYFWLYGQLSRTIAGIIQANELIDSIYLYDSGADVVYASSHGIIRSPRFFDREWMERPVSIAIASRLAPARNVLLPSGIPIRYLSVLVRDLRWGNLLAVNLDADALHRFIERRMGRPPGEAEFFVIGPAGSIELAGTPDPALVERVRSLFVLAGPTARTVLVSADTDELVVARRTSPVLGLTFYSAFRLDVYRSELLQLQLSTALASTLFVIVLLGIASLSSRELYRPIDALFRVLPDELLGPVPTAPARFDEFSVLTRAMSGILSEDRQLRLRLRESLPIVRESFLRLLLDGSTLSIPEIAQRMTSLEIPTGVESLLPVCLAYCSGDKRSGLEQEQLDEVRVLTAVERIMLGTFSGAIARLDATRLCVLLRCDPAGLPRLYELAGTLVRVMREDVGVDMGVGIGAIAQSVRELPDAYRRAVDALEFGLAYNTYEVFTYDEVPAGSGGVTLHYRFRSEIEQLFAYVRSGDSEKSLRVLDQIVATISQNGLHVGRPKLRQFFVRLAADFLDFVDDLGMEPPSIDGTGASLLDAVLTAESVDDYRRIAGQAIGAFAEQAKAATGARENAHIAEIIALLESDVGVTVNLNTIALRMKLSPSYVSRLFSKECGVPFVKYLTDLRVRKARELLCATQMSIQEVGRRVGYPNAAYFTSVFRDRTGTTPAAYRKSHAVR